MTSEGSLRIPGHLFVMLQEIAAGCPRSLLADLQAEGESLDAFVHVGTVLDIAVEWWERIGTSGVVELTPPDGSGWHVLVLDIDDCAASTKSDITSDPVVVLDTTFERLEPEISENGVLVGAWVAAISLFGEVVFRLIEGWRQAPGAGRS